MWNALLTSPPLPFADHQENLGLTTLNLAECKCGRVGAAMSLKLPLITLNGVTVLQKNSQLKDSNALKNELGDRTPSPIFPAKWLPLSLGSTSYMSPSQQTAVHSWVLLSSCSPSSCGERVEWKNCV